jgi:hypothetical protein
VDAQLGVAQRSDWTLANAIGKSQLSRSNSCRQEGFSLIDGVRLGGFPVLSSCFFLLFELLHNGGYVGYIVK